MTSNETPRLAYDDEGSGTPVVLLHGLTFNRTIWRPVVERLRALPTIHDDVPAPAAASAPAELRTITIDLPGHGQSEGAACPLPEVVELIHALLRQRDVEAPVMVGHSISGVIATIYGATFPALGVVNIAQPLDVAPFALLLSPLVPYLTGSNFAQAFEPFQRSMGFEQLSPGLRELVLANQTISRDLVLGYWDGLLHTEANALEREMIKTMARVRCPYLAIFGQPIAPKQRVFMADRLMDLQIEEWPGRGHFLHLADVESFSARLRAFVNCCRSSTSSPARRAEGLST